MGVRTRFANFGLVTALAAGCASSDGGGARDAPAAGVDGGADDASSSVSRDGGGSPATDGSTSRDASTRDGSTSTVPGGVRFVGRVDTSDPAAPKFAWSASGLVATVTGTKVSVTLKSEGSAAFFQPVVDGKAGTRFQVASGATRTVTIGDALAPGDHVVEIYRDTEGMYGDSVFLGFADGTLKGAPSASGRLIEVIGDSISAGYGNLGVEVHPPWDNACSFSLDTESAYFSYGAILARALDAEVSIVARSGWGVYRDLDGSTAGIVPSVYANAVGTDNPRPWDFARKPDAVVINLGTNDSNKGDPGQPFEAAYTGFLQTIRSHYPNAWIFLTMGPMTGDPLLGAMRTHLANVVAAAAAGGDAKVTAIDMTIQDATSTGCDYHPNVAEDQKMSDELAPKIRSRLGW